MSAVTETPRTEEPYGPLRRDVRLLGSLLGRVLIEQEGEDFLEAEERIRASTRVAPARSATPRRFATPSASSRRSAQASMLRAFALYFQLANTAEQHHRIRRRRARGRGHGAAARVARGGLRRGSRRFRPPSSPHASTSVSLELVLTAHPTEATRRTLLRAHVRIAELLDPQRRPRPDLDRTGRARGRSSTEEITILWQTDEVRGERPRVERRDPPRAVVLRGEPLRRRRAAASRLPPARPGRPSAVLVRHLDRRRPRRQPRRRRRDDRRRARTGARDGAAALPRRRSRARDRDRLEPLARPGLGRARGVDRARRARVRRVRARARADERGRGLPPEARVHVVAARQRRLPHGRTSCSPTWR